MKVKKRSKPNVAFILTNKDLSKLNEHIRGFLGGEARVTYTAHCVDLTRTFDDFSQLQKFENSPRQSIQRLEIDASSKDFEKRVDINLGQSVFDDQIEISVSGPEQSTQSTATKLEDVVQGMKAWYSFAATFSLYKAISAVSAILFAAGFVFLAYASATNLPGPSIGVGFLIGFLVGSLYSGFWGALHWLRPRMFPKAVFALGQGEHRHKTIEIWRQLVYVGFPVGIVASLVAGVILLLVWH